MRVSAPLAARPGCCCGEAAGQSTEAGGTDATGGRAASFAAGGEAGARRGRAASRRESALLSDARRTKWRPGGAARAREEPARAQNGRAAKGGGRTPGQTSNRLPNGEMAQKRSSKRPGPSQAELMEVDEEYTLTQTPTSSQVQRNIERRPQSQMDARVNELVRFLLVKDQKKIPIKRADILKYVVKDYKDVCPELLKRANQTLQRVFGLELVEIDPKHHTYILVSKLPQLDRESSKEDDNTPKMGLLTIVLSLIFMKGNMAKEAAVWEVLRRLRIDPGKKHKILGDVKKLLTEEFVRQKYLEYNRLPHTDPPEFEFRWGPRAAKETSKKQILQFVAKIQKKDPKFWMSQYNEAEAEAGGAGRC